MSDPTLRGHSPLKCVVIERIKQDVKWGVQNHSDLRWLPILMEEVGEVSETINEAYPHKENIYEYEYEACIDSLEYELIQVAAVCLAWVECIRRRDRIEADNGNKQ